MGNNGSSPSAIPIGVSEHSVLLCNTCQSHSTKIPSQSHNREHEDTSAPNPLLCQPCHDFLIGQKTEYWAPDAYNCHQCKSPLSAAHRHHCRVCGESFCDSHCIAQLSLCPSYPPVRTCPRCTVLFPSIIKIHYAASVADLETLRVLLLGTPSLATCLNPRHRTTPLYIASRNGHVEVCKLLIETYAVDVNGSTGRTNSTALHTACYYNHEGCVKYLLSVGSLCTVTNKFQEIPLHNAKQGKGQGLSDDTLATLQLTTCKEEEFSRDCVKKLKEYVQVVTAALENGERRPKTKDHDRWVDSYKRPSDVDAMVDVNKGVGLQPYWPERNYPTPGSSDDVRMITWFLALPDKLPEIYGSPELLELFEDWNKHRGLKTVLEYVIGVLEDKTSAFEWKAALLKCSSAEDVGECIVSVFLYTCELTHPMTRENSSLYYVMNRAMRDRSTKESKRLLDVFRPFMWRLDKSLRMLPKQRVMSHRGMKWFTASEYTNQSEVVWTCFSSTSRNASTAKGFCGERLGQQGSYIVTAIRNGVDVSWASRYGEGEQESLLTCNTRFAVALVSSDEEMQALNTPTRYILLQEITPQTPAESTIRLRYDGLREMFLQSDSVFVEPTVNGGVGLYSIVEKQIQRKGGILLIGDAGSGKSTTMIALTSYFLQATMASVNVRPWFPIHIPLHLVNLDMNLLSVVLNRFALDVEGLQLLCSAFRVALLLDAADESEIGLHAATWNDTQFPVEVVVVSIRTEYLEGKRMSSGDAADEIESQFPSNREFHEIYTEPFAEQQMRQYFLKIAELDVKRAEEWGGTAKGALVPLPTQNGSASRATPDVLKHLKSKYLCESLLPFRHHLRLPIVLWVSVYGAAALQQLSDPKATLLQVMRLSLEGYIQQQITKHSAASEGGGGAAARKVDKSQVFELGLEIATQVLRTATMTITNKEIVQHPLIHFLPVRTLHSASTSHAPTTISFRHRIITECFGACAILDRKIALDDVACHINTYGILKFFPVPSELLEYSTKDALWLRSALGGADVLDTDLYLQHKWIITDDDLRTSILPRYHTLREFKNSKIPMSYATLVSVLQHGANLQCLQIPEFHTLSDVTLTQCVMQCPLLTKLHIDGNDISDTTLRLVIQSTSQNLRMLAIPGCVKVHDGILKDIVKCKQLTHLDLSGATCLTESTARAIAASCNQLQTLKLGDCDLLTNGCIKDILTKCPRIAHIDLGGCTKLGDVALKDIARLLAGRLQSLGMRKTNITNAGLIDVSCQCLELVELDVSGCVKITEVGVIAIVTECVMLSTLNVMGCKKVNVVNVQAAVGYNPAVCISYDEPLKESTKTKL